MNEDSNNLSKLTEFPPLSPSDESYGISGLIARFFRSSKAPEEAIKQVAEEQPSASSVDQWTNEDEKEEKEEDNLPINTKGGRSLPSVRKRIGNLLALKGVGRQSYSNTELKQYWMPDSVSKECYNCGERFTTFRRRHHCRVCGQIFCARCCNQQIPGKIMNCTGDLRVCLYCGRVVLSYLKSAELNSELTEEHIALLNELQGKFGDSNDFEIEGRMLPTPDREEVRRKPSVGYQEETFGSSVRADAAARSSLRCLLDELLTSGSLVVGTHRFRLRTYTACFPSSHLVDSLVAQNKAANRIQAVVLGQALLKSGQIEAISHETSVFTDNHILYKILPFEPVREENHDSSAESDDYLVDPNSLRGSASSYNLNLNVDSKTAHISKPQETLATNGENDKKESPDKPGDTGVKAVSEVTSSVSLDVINWNTIDPSELEGEQKLALESLRSHFSNNCNNFLKQILNNEGLTQSWAEFITPTACQVVKNIRPEKSKTWMEAMDIRQYVQIKKVSGGEKRGCQIISGVVCSKNLSHRKMPTSMKEPRILLLSSSIMFQRDEGKYLSLEPVIMQENDYLQRVVSKIVNLRPNLLIVGKSVARVAQDLLLEAGISLVLNVKPSVVERIARCTGADILTSVDAHLGAPELGVCQHFQVTRMALDNGRYKTLMIFEGCRYPELGCTILIRGAPNHELSKVKKATAFLLFAYYSARMEVSYHMDSLAKPPTLLKEEFLDSLDDNFTSDELATPSEVCSPSRKSLPEEKLKSLQETPKSQSETVSDLSDPLRSTWKPKDEADGANESLALVEVPNEINKFRKALDENLLSVSPFLKFSLPYLETEQGRTCALRSFFGQRLYWSPQLCDDYPKQRSSTAIEEIPTIEQRLETIKLKQLHPFVTAKLTQSADSMDFQTSLANFRAVGGRIPIQPNPACSATGLLPPLQDLSQSSRSKDIFDPANHQRLAVLFCSYSPLSRNAPSFCVDPWIVDMEMYGTMDIPFGQFLERYCFRPDYTCGSEACETPVLEHTRRFVHNGGAVHIKLRHLEKEIPPLGGILMWSWCTLCSKMTSIRCMSPGAKCMSFAKYLELRFHADMYKVRNIDCIHSLHQDHVHYFAKSKTLATFTYSKISSWEVCLPPQTLKTERELFNEALKMDECKVWSLLATQMSNSVINKLTSLCLPEGSVVTLKQQLLKDQHVIRQRVEETQQKLSPSSGALDSPKLNIGHMWSVEDSLVRLKRQVAECVEEWNIRLNDAETAAKKEDKKKSQESKMHRNSLSEIIDGEKEIVEELEASEAQVAEEANEPEDKIIDIANEIESAVDTDDGEPITQSAQFEERKQTDKKSVKTILSQLLPNSNQNVHIQLSTAPTEHYLLPTGTIMPLVVYEKEPSSIIAYALNSFEYKMKLDQHRFHSVDQQSPSMKRKTGADVRESDSSSGDRKSGKLSYLRTVSSSSMDKNSKGAAFDGVHYNPSIPANEGFVDEEQKVDEIKSKLPKADEQNIEVNFSDGNASFKVKVYYADDFAKLRASVLPEGEEGFIRSLSRCVAWAATGGKSGSNFNKTKDDRFILKAMARIEIQQFLDFAPQYFNYINCRVVNSVPTLLGKILGVFRIVCRSERNNIAMKLLVMEHLFHGRCIRHKFDLKGSMRNRLVETTNEPHGETVLLDENLINMTCDSPLYVLPHSKAVLMQAIHNDTLFLASQSVMDYSLLVGLDETKSHLVVGIIDYIRGYTWDKKIETMVKRIGQAKDPTIIPADEYRKRFIAAMHRYFLPVPDRWTGHGQGIDVYTRDMAC